MENGTVKCYFKPQGLQRKELAHIIAEVVSEKVIYEGPPTFAFRVGGWYIDRDGDISGAEVPFENRAVLRQLFTALSTAGVTIEKAGMVAEGHSGKSLKNLVNIISGKDRLICKALGIGGRILPEDAAEHVNDAIFPTKKSFKNAVNRIDKIGRIRVEFDNKTIYFLHVLQNINPDEAMAAIALFYTLSEQAKQKKHSFPIEKPAENEKYAMRDFLVSIGLGGDDFKRERKALLSHLSGDIIYQKIEM